MLKRNHEATLAQLRRIGATLLDVKIPEFTTDVSAIGAESSSFHYDLVQSGRDKQMTNPNRGIGMRRSRLIPAVEYLQHQRIRMMMMMKLAEATAHVDVYLAPRSTSIAPAGGAVAAAGGGAAAGPAGAGAPGGGGGGGGNQDQNTVTQRHSSMANLATYPAVALPNGFTEDALPLPTSIGFFARPFGETELLALAKAYQDATDFHRRHPNLDA